MRDLRRADTSTGVVRLGSGPASRALLGTEGAGLTRLGELGLPTPPGFAVTTEAWRGAAADGAGPVEVPAPVRAAIAEQLAGLTDASPVEPGMPLLVAVRTSAPAAVPGVLGPVVDAGIGEATLGAVTALAGRAFAGARYLAFLRSFGSAVRGLTTDELDAEGARHDDPVDAARAVRDVVAERSGLLVPDDLESQLDEVVTAAWTSWDASEARAHRVRGRLPDDLGVAVVVQAMVHGDRDHRSGRGTAWSRDPATGSPSATGGFAPHAPDGGGDGSPAPLSGMHHRFPTPLAELDAALPLVEASYRDMCAVDFVVQSGRLWFLRARPAERSGPAAVRIAVDLVDDGLITTPEALARIPLSVMRRLQEPVFVEDQHATVPAQPDLRVARVLQWADERRAVELLGAAPAGATVVTGPGDVGASSGVPVLVAVPVAEDGCGDDLARTVAALLDAGVGALLLGAPTGAGMDAVRPPAAPWTAVVGDPDSWAVRLLAGRLEVVGVA